MSEFYPARRNFFKTRTIDITFTVILGLFTFVFGYYVFISIRNFKVVKVKKALVAVVVPPHKTIRHKFKHRPKSSVKRAFPNVSFIDTTANPASQQTPVVQPQPQIYTDKNSIASLKITDVMPKEAKPASVISNTEKQPVKEASLPYTTNLRANETGVINMRKFDNYSSEIIKVILTNSEIAVLERGNSYYKVLFKNTTGYVAKWNVLKK